MNYKEKYEMALEGIQEILDSGEDYRKKSMRQTKKEEPVTSSPKEANQSLLSTRKLKQRALRG